MTTRRMLMPRIVEPFGRLHGLSGLSPEHTGRVLQQMQENAEEATRKNRAQPERRARTITGISVPGYLVGPPEVGEFRVSHGLGFAPSRWRVLRNTGAAPQLHEVSKTSRMLVLMNKSADACKIDLEVA